MVQSIEIMKAWMTGISALHRLKIMRKGWRAGSTVGRLRVTIQLPAAVLAQPELGGSL